MKPSSQTSRWLRSGLFSLLAALSAGNLLAQIPRPYTNIVVEPFDTDAGVARFNMDTAPGSSLFDFSATEDANGNPSSGSMKVTLAWPNLAPNEWSEAQFSMNDPVGVWPGRSMSPYYTVEFDIKVDQANSFIGTDGKYGGVQMVFQGWDGAGINSGSGWNPLGRVGVNQQSGWQHVTQTLGPFQNNNLNKFVVNFLGQNSATNTMVYYVDNLKISLPSGPPPTLALNPPPKSGLHLTTVSQYGRQSVRTVGTNFTWVGAAAPVTYSVTIGSYPNSAVYTNFQTHIFLVPGMANNANDPDWSSPNIVTLMIENGANGTTYANFRYKTNEAGGNTMLYGSGTIAFKTNTMLLGTWSLSFSQNTNATITAPDGTTTNFVFEAGAAGDVFDTTNMRVYFGAQANRAEGIGQEALLTGANITGAGGGLSDTFTGASLNTTKWQVSAGSPANVVQVPGGVAYNLTWPVPDNLFKLNASTNAADPTSWRDPGLSAALAGTTKKVAIPTGVPSLERGFFGLFNRTPTKFQILLPGETAAPGTLTGKTGTPVDQTVNQRFNVVVNAVDANWYPAYSNDRAELYIGGNTNFGYTWAQELIQGSYTFGFTNTEAGTYQITVTNWPNGALPNTLSSSYTVNP